MSLDNMAKEARLEEIEKTRTDLILSKSFALFKMSYGLALVVFGRLYPNQVRFITMMRSMGFQKIEQSAATVKTNLVQAVLSVVRNAPSLYFLTKAAKDATHIVERSRKIREANKKALDDGVISKWEERKIWWMQTRHERAVKRDLRQLKRGATSLGRIWKTIDFDEIKDLASNFFFTATCVLSSGHNRSFVRKVISRYCLTLNLGSLIHDTSRKLGFPLARLLLTRHVVEHGMDDEERELVRRAGTALMYSYALFAVLFQNEYGRRLNASMTSAFLMERGLTDLTGATVFDVSRRAGDAVPVEDANGDDHSIISRRVAGLLSVFLTSVGMVCSKGVDDGTLTMPRWLERTRVMSTIETVVTEIVHTGSGT